MGISNLISILDQSNILFFSIWNGRCTPIEIAIPLLRVIVKSHIPESEREKLDMRNDIVG